MISLLVFVYCSVAVKSAEAGIILFEDFEDADITYSASVADDFSDIANRNYFGRISAATLLPSDISYGNTQGTGFYGAQDTDSAGSGNIDVLTIEWTAIDISGFSDLVLSWMVAEDDATDGNEDWDLPSSVRLEVQNDGAGYVQIFGIESESAVVGNRVPRVDTDFDGVGEGIEITDSFSQFSRAISAGSTLDIRLTIQELDTGDEDIAFDNLLLEGNSTSAVPEPSSIVLTFVAIFVLSCANSKRVRATVS